nr:pectin acetylesterase 8-like [Tanacetum cinerariifolium]
MACLAKEMEPPFCPSVLSTLSIIECSNNVEMTFIQRAIARGADGSPPAYQFDKGFGGLYTWLIHIQGGGRYDSTESWSLSCQPNQWLPSKVKSLLKGTFYVAWWSIWRFRNHSIFDNIRPRRSEVFIEVFKKCDPESLMKSVCLSAIEETLFPVSSFESYRSYLKTEVDGFSKLEHGATCYRRVRSIKGEETIFLILFGKFIVNAAMAMMNLSGFGKGEILCTLVWRPIAVAAMARSYLSIRFYVALCGQSKGGCDESPWVRLKMRLSAYWLGNLLAKNH